MIRLLIFLLSMGIPSMAQSYKCVPTEFHLDDVVTATRVATSSGKEKIEKVTIRQTLKKMSARCSGNRLLDKRRREIRFYRLQGCWGNPPENYVEIIDRQRREINDLKKRFTVVELTCNPSGLDIP